VRWDSQLKIATFNINNINKRLANLLVWLERAGPDVACLQELRTEHRAFPESALKALGYGAVWQGERSWNGVAILARGSEPVLTRVGLPDDTEDHQARYIEAAVKYTRARLSIAPCVATYTCSGADEARLDRAGEAFGTPLDRRVWEAMGQAHETDALRSSDFPKDVVGLVAETARDPVLNPRTEARFKATRTPLTCGSASRQ